MESCDHPPPPVLGAAAETPSLSSSESSKLPKYMILRSMATVICLRYIDPVPGSHNVSHLGFFADKGVNPKDKFEVVPSTVYSDHVHIKSCYNNKYWDCHEEIGHVTASASEPVEDMSNINYCTLFKPVYEDIDDGYGNKTLSLYHGAARKYLKALQSSGQHLLVLSDDGDRGDVLSVIDWETIVILPKRLVFKGQNGKYLTAYTQGKYQYVAFQSEKNNTEFVVNEITQKPDGTVSMRNERFDKFWRIDLPHTPWIYVDADSPGTIGAYFKPVLLETNTKIALQSLRNKKFCTFDPKADFSSSCSMIANSNVINENAYMTIEEPVVSRVIDNVKFRLKDAKRIDEASVFADSDHILNTTDHLKTKFTKVITLAESNSSTWDNIASVKFKVSTTLKASIPIIADGEIKLSAEIAKSYKWGGVDKEETEIGGKLTAAVPKNSKFTINLTYTKGTCEVPFSYAQHDTLTNGVLETTQMEGGIYTGINCYNFKFETIESSLTPV